MLRKGLTENHLAVEAAGKLSGNQEMSPGEDLMEAGRWRIF